MLQVLSLQEKLEEQDAEITRLKQELQQKNVMEGKIELGYDNIIADNDGAVVKEEMENGNS